MFNCHTDFVAFFCLGLGKPGAIGFPLSSSQLFTWATSLLIAFFCLEISNPIPCFFDPASHQNTPSETVCVWTWHWDLPAQDQCCTIKGISGKAVEGTLRRRRRHIWCRKQPFLTNLIPGVLLWEAPQEYFHYRSSRTATTTLPTTPASAIVSFL